MSEKIYHEIGSNDKIFQTGYSLFEKLLSRDFLNKKKFVPRVVSVEKKIF